MKISFLWICIIIISSCSYYPTTKKESLANVKFNWEKTSTQHYDYYYEPKSVAAKYIDSAKIYHEKGFAELLKYLDVESYDKRLNLFMVDSRERMEQLIGLKTNGAANTTDGTFYYIFNENIQSYGKHEVCHIIAANQWGSNKDIWISEGLAVASDGKWWSYDLHSIANYLYKKGKLIPIEELINHFWNYNDLLTYPESGSFVKFIRDKYGIDIIKNLYSKGAIVFEKHLNKSISVIENEWLDEIKKYNSSNVQYEEKVKMFGAKI